MKCSIQGCPGEYQKRNIIHTVRKGEDIYVFDDVPAEVCSVCGDTILAPDTIMHLENLLKEKTPPERFIPLLKYAS